MQRMSIRGQKFIGRGRKIIDYQKAAFDTSDKQCYGYFRNIQTRPNAYSNL